MGKTLECPNCSKHSYEAAKGMCPFCGAYTTWRKWIIDHSIQAIGLLAILALAWLATKT